MNIDEKIASLTEATQALLAQPRCHRRQLPTPIFDGSTDVLTFTQKFRKIAHINEWDEEEALIRLQNAVSGNANQGLDSCTSTDQIIERLHNRYSLTEQGASQLLKNLKWSVGEDLYSFTDYVRRLVHTAYTGLDDAARERLAIKEFIQAIPRSLQTVHWELTQRPRDNMEEVIKIVRQYEAMGGMNKINKVELEELREVKDQLKMQAELLTKLSENQMLLQQQITQDTKRTTFSNFRRTDPRIRKPLSEVTCYRCEQKGHIARNCNTKVTLGN